MMFLNSCSTQDDNSKNAVAANAKNLEKRLAAIAPPAGFVTDIVFKNTSTDKTLIVADLEAVGRVPSGSPAVAVYSKGQFPGNNGYLFVLPGQSVTFSDYVVTTTTLNSTGAVLPIDNAVRAWATRIATNPTTFGGGQSPAILNTYGFSNPYTAAPSKFAKWDFIIIAALDGAGQYYSTVTSTPNGTSNPNTRYYLNASANATSTITPLANTDIKFGIAPNRFRVTKNVVGTQIIITAENYTL